MARKKFTTNLDEQVIQDLKMQAVIEGRASSRIIEELLKEYLEKQTKSVRDSDSSRH